MYNVKCVRKTCEKWKRSHGHLLTVSSCREPGEWCNKFCSNVCNLVFFTLQAYLITFPSWCANNYGKSKKYILSTRGGRLSHDRKLGRMIQYIKLKANLIQIKLVLYYNISQHDHKSTFEAIHVCKFTPLKLLFALQVFCISPQRPEDSGGDSYKSVSTRFCRDFFVFFSGQKCLILQRLYLIFLQ